MLHFFSKNDKESDLKISNKGRVLIPAELRKKYNLHAGSEVVIVDYGGVLTIVPAVKDPVRLGRGFLVGGASISAGLKQDRKFEETREARLLNKKDNT